MILLCERSQQKILLAYQFDYHFLLQSYNKLGGKKSEVALDAIHTKATNLHDEIINYTNPRKYCFSDENVEFANNIAYTVQNFIKNLLEGSGANSCRTLESDNSTKNSSCKFSEHAA